MIILIFSKIYLRIWDNRIKKGYFGMRLEVTSKFKIQVMEFL